MTETIRCPGCSTRFTLSPERVQAGLRRAKCFRCETIFEIGDVVERLLQALPPEEIQVPAAPAEAIQAPAPPPEEIRPPAPPEPREEPSLFAPFDAPPPPSLTLGDLDGTEDEIMEKTLVILPPPGLPEVAEADPASTGGFSSARDAISKLMGDAPAAHSTIGERRLLGSRSPMDVEATLDALDVTLGGNQPVPPPPPHEATTSTMKLSAHEIQAAMASVGAQTRPHATLPPPMPPPPMMVARAEIPPPPRSVEPPPAPGADLLKIQVEQETLTNVTIDQVTAWIEQGRVHEYHMVARQFSDHWIEAIKVPALRPVFDRKRRDGAASAEAPAPAPELAPAKKSLFGGLFGRN